MPGQGPLPEGFRIEPDRATRLLDGGSVVAGGAPIRLLRLTAGGQRLVRRLFAGEQVPPTAGAQGLVRRLLRSGAANPQPPPSAMRLADVTVVIPCRAPVRELEAALGAAAAAGRVIVVDDGSADADGVAAACSRAGATLVRRDESRGPSAARELGWRRARTPIVAFVDTGCSGDDGWLDALLAHFADPEVGAVAPRITPAAPPGGPGWLLAYEQHRSSLDLGDRPGPVRPGSWVPYVPTAALVVRRAALEDVGGFDPALRHAEDVDLVWRLAAAGWTVRYEPAVTVRHPVRPSAGEWLRQRYDYGTGAGPLAARHGRAVAPLAVSAWSAAVWALALLGFRKVALALAAGTTLALVPKLEALDHPVAEAGRLAGLGHLYAGRMVADALRRPWWPLLALAAIVSRRARRALALVAVVPPVIELVQERPDMDLLSWLGARLADDAAYGAGVWVGSWRARVAGALIPNLVGWPSGEAVERA